MTVFVGRTGELQELERRLERALDRRGSIVFITGDAGAGKSSVVERFLVDAALKAPDARIIGTACSEQYGAGEPYQPFAEGFRDLVSEPERRGSKGRLKEMAAELAPYWLAAIPLAGGLIAATAATAVELKKTLGGVATAVAPPSEEALFFQFTEVFLTAAAHHPIVLFIDDLHWADRASVSLLAHLGRKIADQPVLILGTYRPADVEVTNHPIKQAKLELERYGIAHELALPPLETDALAQFIREELGAPPTPELLTWLERRAGTNPLFFGELLKWLVEHRIAQEQHGEWALARLPEEIEIPRSAESAIEKRLTRLQPDLYRLLEYASVEGNEFHSTILARLRDIDELALEEAMEPLVKVHRLVRLAGTRTLPDGELASVYEFQHSLVQDVLHRNLQGKRRILLHRKIAEILEHIYAADPALIAHRLAIHYDEARDPERAYGFAVSAAERASHVYAHWDAIELLQRALRNSLSDDRKTEVLDRLADEHRLIGRYSEALSLLRDALKVTASRDDHLRALALKRKCVVVDREFGNRSPERLLDQLRELAQEARQLEARAELCHILWTYRGLPGAGKAHEAAQEALRIAEELGEPALVAKAQYELGTVLLLGQEPARAIPHLREALRLYTEQEDTDRAGLCHNCLAIVHVRLGDYRMAIQEFDAAAGAFESAGDPPNAASVRNNLGVLLARIGDWGRAETNLREAIRIAQRMDATARLLHPLENLARLHQLKGDREAAREHWRRLLEKARETGYWNAEIIARCGLGLLDLEEGDLPPARAELDETRRLQRDEDAWTESRQACQLLGARLAATEGDLDSAIELLEAGETALASRDRFHWATFRLAHGEILARKDPERAAPIVREALETFRNLGAEPMRQKAESLLAKMSDVS